MTTTSNSSFPDRRTLPGTGGGFGDTVDDPNSVTLNGSTLSAKLRKNTYNTDKATNMATIDLNTCIANENSKLTWKKDGNFMKGQWATVKNAKLNKDPNANKWTLEAEVQDAVGISKAGQTLNLEEGLRNSNGNFLFVQPGTFDVTTQRGNQ